MDYEWDDKTVTANESSLIGISNDSKAYLVVLEGEHGVGEMFALKGEQVLGRGLKANLRLRGDGISRRHVRFSTRDKTVLLEDLNSTNGTYVNGCRIDRTYLKDGDKIQVGNSVILKFTFHDKLDEGFQRQMYEAASRDGLTKAYNKRFFMEQLPIEIGYARRHKFPLSLIVMDLDRFKSVNDQHGHLVGDQVLSSFSRITAEIIRAEDIFARYGGEEFVILSRNTDIQSAALLAERIRGKLEDYEHLCEGQALKVTASVGVATYHEEFMADGEDLVKAADEAMYEAKRRGRNCVVIKETDG